MLEHALLLHVWRYGGVVSILCAPAMPSWPERVKIIVRWWIIDPVHQGVLKHTDQHYSVQIDV